jgi:hypothetical protein
MDGIAACIYERENEFVQNVRIGWKTWDWRPLGYPRRRSEENSKCDLRYIMCA